MTRSTCAVVRKKRHNKWLKMAKGYRGMRKSSYKVARVAVEKALQYQYRDRKNRKRNFRSLWIIRINAAARSLGMKYSEFMHKLSQSDMNLDRKILAHIAMEDSAAFESIFRKVTQE